MSMPATAMSKRLTGQTILITGASSGIGAATALEFARTAPTDLRLILTARRADKLNQLQQTIAEEVGPGVKCLCTPLDLAAGDDAIRAFVDSIPADWRNIDVLVNNAGMVLGVDRAPSINPSHITTMFTTNVLALISLTQAVLPLMLSRPSSAAPSSPSSQIPGSGTVIMLGSIAGREGYPGGSIYCATKAAVRTFTDALRRELVATRVRVCEIDPGQVETEFSLVRFHGDKEKAAKVYEGCEALTAEDVAETVVWVAGRRENVVVADTLVYPNHQAAATVMHRRT